LEEHLRPEASDQLPEMSAAPVVPSQLAIPVFSPRITYILIGLNVLIALPTLFSVELQNLFWGVGALVPVYVFQLGQFWRIFTSGFLHANLTHLAFNMYALYGLGRLLEQLYGGKRFLGVYFLALIGGGVAVLAGADLDTATIGASGAVLGLAGALVVYFWIYRDFLTQARQQLYSLLPMVVINVLLGLIPGISLWGHLGGVLAGAAAGWALRPRYQGVRTETGFELRVRPLNGMDLGSGLLVCLGEGIVLGLAWWLRG